MARLPNLTSRDDVPEELLEAYDRVTELRNGAVSGPYGILLHSPEVAMRGAALSSYVRFQSALEPYQREIAIMTVARHLDAAVMWAGHIMLGRQAGVREEVINAIAHHGDIDSLNVEEAETVRYVRELFETNRISDQTFAALHSRVGDQGIVDLTALVGYYGFVGAVLNGFEIDAPEGAPRLP
ncbi:MAG: carboxymuconolactone decarboxylase family protein [Dehalococcoidia bacterium]|jgi:4-carboxymuconolactone decarboxylase|nr:carboxymuconolactone decarboxylase family protein [Dehalococcoidia bacterium]